MHRPRQAMSAVKSDIVIAEIAAIEGIVADDVEINAAFEQYKNQYGLSDEQFAEFKKANLDNLAHDLVTRKVIDLLMQSNN